jgi:hypothetical protein
LTSVVSRFIANAASRSAARIIGLERIVEIIKAELEKIK